MPAFGSPLALMKRVVVYIRYPFKRGNFKDPAQIPFTDKHERELWEHLLGYRHRDAAIDWEHLSGVFGGVDIAYLQQVSYWLYEKELLDLKREIREATVKAAESSQIPATRFAGPPPPAPSKGVTFSNPFFHVTPVTAVAARVNPATVNVRQVNEVMVHSTVLCGVPVDERNSPNQGSVGLAGNSDSDDEVLFDRSLLPSPNRLLGSLFPSRTSPQPFAQLDKRLQELRLGWPAPLEVDDDSEVSASSLSKSALERALING